jgi:hypothetical protein
MIIEEKTSSQGGSGLHFEMPAGWFPSLLRNQMCQLDINQRWDE